MIVYCLSGFQVWNIFLEFHVKIIVLDYIHFKEKRKEKNGMFTFKPSAVVDWRREWGKTTFETESRARAITFFHDSNALKLF